ncbi:unnamed protein product, partial [Durusdinium trenchii]
GCSTNPCSAVASTLKLCPDGFRAGSCSAEVDRSKHMQTDHAQDWSALVQCTVKVAQDTKHQVFSLREGTVVRVGRSAANDVVIDSDGVSQFHAELFIRTGAKGGVSGLCIRDNSKNGTGVRPAPHGATSKMSNVDPFAWETLHRGAFRVLEDGWEVLLPMRARRGGTPEKPTFKLYLDKVFAGEEEELDGEEWKPFEENSHANSSPKQPDKQEAKPPEPRPPPPPDLDGGAFEEPPPPPVPQEASAEQHRASAPLPGIPPVPQELMEEHVKARMQWMGISRNAETAFGNERNGEKHFASCDPDAEAQSCSRRLCGPQAQSSHKMTKQTQSDQFLIPKLRLHGDCRSLRPHCHQEVPQATKTMQGSRAHRIRRRRGRRAHGLMKKILRWQESTTAKLGKRARPRRRRRRSGARKSKGNRQNSARILKIRKQRSPQSPRTREKIRLQNIVDHRRSCLTFVTRRMGPTMLHRLQTMILISRRLGTALVDADCSLFFVLAWAANMHKVMHVDLLAE